MALRPANLTTQPPSPFAGTGQEDWIDEFLGTANAAPAEATPPAGGTKKL